MGRPKLSDPNQKVKPFVIWPIVQDIIDVGKESARIKAVDVIHREAVKIRKNKNK